MSITLPIMLLSIPKPAGSNAQLDRDLEAEMLARASLDFLGDETTFGVTAAKVTAWNSRVGALAFTQTNAAQQPDYATSGGLGDKARAILSGTADANGDRMSFTGGVLAVNQARTIVEVLSVADTTATRYLDGLIGASNDAIAGFVSAAGGGLINQRWGDATASAPIIAGNPTIVLRSYSGAGLVEIQTYDTVTRATGRGNATATVAPTTPRAWTLGATATLGNGGLWTGWVQRRHRNKEWVGTDRAFWRDVVGAVLKSRYALADNPIAAT